MKNRKAKVALAATILTAANVIAAPAFAANPYGIVYTGGQELGEETVTINPTLLGELTPLIDMGADDVEIIFSDSNLWKEGYSDNGYCTPIKYIEVSDSTDLSSVDDLYYAVYNRQYIILVGISSIIKDELSFTAENAWVAAGVLTGNSATPKGTPKGSLEVGFKVASDESCETAAADNVSILSTHGAIFLDTKQFLLASNDPNKVFSSSELYYGIMDIDAAQAFKILNAGNELTKSNIFAKSAAALQPTTGELKNMYVEEGKYIYGQGSIAKDSDVYVKLSETTQNEGLNMVYGFASRAGSPISYYAKQYTVTYLSDKNGKIKDVGSEDIIAGKNPFGTTSTPNSGYELDYWTANKDVTLTNGTIIRAGKPITTKQVNQVVVNEDITFTAVHKAIEEAPIKVPDTGASTQDTNAALIAISIIGIISGAAIIGILPRITHKIRSIKRFMK